MRRGSPGTDLVLFENPIRLGSDEEGWFLEVATLSLSEDGETWYDLPTQIDPTWPVSDPRRYQAADGFFAGLVPRSEGGDKLDLALWIDAGVLPPGFRACQLRLSDGGTRHVDRGNAGPDAYLSGADIDAVGGYFPTD